MKDQKRNSLQRNIEFVLVWIDPPVRKARSMIDLQGSQLVFQFPDVHPDAVCRIAFQRTLRIPDDNRDYPLPAGLGRFPLTHVRQHVGRVPEDWRAHGGVVLAMYQAEAMWIEFGREWFLALGYPCAIKIAAGKVNAVSGQPWSETLSDQPQDYVTTPGQPWLDGFCIQKGLIRQFVAMPLGVGYTAEEQISGAARNGGLQIVVYPMKRARYEDMMRKRREARDEITPCAGRVATVWCKASDGMGLAPGGLMRQKIYPDRQGIDAWDQTQGRRCFVHILNSTQWQAVTGQPTPGAPPSATDYEDAGLPWFEYYGDSPASLKGSESLARLDSVTALGLKQGQKPLSDNASAMPASVLPLGPGAHTVEDGCW